MTTDGLRIADEISRRNGLGSLIEQPPDDAEPLAPSRLGTVLRRSELSTLPAVESLIDGVMSYPASVLVVGEYGVGKTFAALSLACSVATGRPWLGRAVVQRRVLFVIGEGAYGLDARVRAWELAWHGGAAVPDDRLTFMIKPDSLSERGTWLELTRDAVDGGYGMVVLDTFSSLAPDADETKDAAKIIRWLSNLSTAIGGAAVLIHHPGWSDAGRSRGGYQLEANADEVLILRNVAEGSALFTMTRKKVKDGPGGEVHWLRRSPSDGSVIVEGARSDDASVPLRDRIVAVLANYGDTGATGPQLIGEINPSSRSTFYAALNRLRDEGIVTEVGRGNSRRYFLAAQAPEARPT